MKAARIHRHGAADELRLEDAPRPEPGPGEVLIRVAVAGVNPADHKHRSGMFKDFVKYVFPKILGYDVAGVIEATGPGVTGLAPGDRVAIVGMGCTPFGEQWNKGTDDLLVDAAEATFAAAGITKDDVDAYWLGTLGSGQSGLTLRKALAIDYKPVTRVENYCASGSEAFRNA